MCIIRSRRVITNQSWFLLIPIVEGTARIDKSANWTILEDGRFEVSFGRHPAITRNKFCCNAFVGERWTKAGPGAELNMDQFARLIPATNRFPSAANGQGFKPLADY